MHMFTRPPANACEEYDARVTWNPVDADKLIFKIHDVSHAKRQLRQEHRRDQAHPQCHHDRWQALLYLQLTSIRRSASQVSRPLQVDLIASPRGEHDHTVDANSSLTESTLSLACQAPLSTETFSRSRSSQLPKCRRDRWQALLHVQLVSTEMPLQVSH